MEMTHIHPHWNGNVTNGYDIALMRVPHAVDISLPALAAPNFELYANHKVYGLKLGPSLQYAQFDVVKNKFCPELKTLGSAVFCAYSSEVSMEPGRLSLDSTRT